MPMRDLPPDLERLSLGEVEAALAGRRLPPIEKWHPERRGDSEMRIARDGRWYHQGGEIKRPEMVRLFSTILRREPDGRFVLVTPAEMLDIAVEDAPFVAVGVKSEGKARDRQLAFQLNTGDVLIAGPDNAISLRGGTPYLHVRAGLEARIDRASWYQLADWAIEEGSDPPALWSRGTRFVLSA